MLSNFLTINAGVPHGSKIGPFSFIAKINDLPDVAVTNNSTNKESISMFIDDTTLSEILNLETWNLISIGYQRFAPSKGMVLNAKKTKEMIFDFRVNKTTFNSISSNDLENERVSSFKLLSIWLDDNLKWNSNTDYIVKKAESGCTFLKF